MTIEEFQCRVLTRRELAPGVFELCFEADKPFVFEAGQYISVSVPCPNPKLPPMRRAYSIASAPGKTPVELCVQLVPGGPGSNYLNDLRIGDVFRGFAPYGFFTYHPKPGRDVLFVATGTGVAPFRSMVLSQAFQNSPPRRTRVLLGVRTPSDLLYEADFRGLEWTPCLSKASAPGAFSGRVTDYLRALGDDFPWLQTEFYLCGNGGMIKEARALLKERGVARDSIHLEIYFQPGRITA